MVARRDDSHDRLSIQGEYRTSVARFSRHLRGECLLHPGPKRCGLPGCPGLFTHGVEPVDDDAQRRRAVSGLRLQHQEALTVPRDVERLPFRGCRTLSCPRTARAACRMMSWAPGYVNDHHLVVSAVEQLTAAERPHRLDAAVVRDLPCAAFAGAGPHVDLVARRLRGDVGDPASIGRERRHHFPGRTEQRARLPAPALRASATALLGRSA